MKKLIIPGSLALAALVLLSGCIAVGSGPKTNVCQPTVGQQLVDLQKARDTGAINEAEFQAQKAKILNHQ